MVATGARRRGSSLLRPPRRALSTSPTGAVAGETRNDRDFWLPTTNCVLRVAALLHAWRQSDSFPRTNHLVLFRRNATFLSRGASAIVGYHHSNANAKMTPHAFFVDPDRKEAPTPTFHT
eukprot:scaffold15157_cov27-Tisochrysis_lutea.AAC.4